MGRTLRRVPLDFAWPLKMTWKGYVSPYRSQKCAPCDGSGQNPATKQIADDFYDFANTGRRWCDRITQDEADALIAAGRCGIWADGKWTHPPRTAESINAENRRGARGIMGNDAINRWILIDTRAKRLGVYGKCATCNGDGEVWATPEVKALAEAWDSFDPPTGDGYQLWETTSEGSPISPVFATLDDLCGWAADNATTFGSFKASAEEWRDMLDGGLVAHREGSVVFI